MTPTEVSEIIEKLRRLVWDLPPGQEDQFSVMRDAARAIETWQSEGGVGDIPHRRSLESWGLIAPNGEPEAEDTTAAAGTTDAGATPQPAPGPDVPGATTDEARVDAAPPTDPDDALQEAFDQAHNFLIEGNFHEARYRFAELVPRATGRLREDVARYYDEARERLILQVQPLVDEAARYDAAHPDEMEGRAARWSEVLAKAPDNEAANQAMRQLAEQREEQKLLDEIATLRADVNRAVEALRLADLERARGNAIGLRDSTPAGSLRGQLETLVYEIEVKRDELRGTLGRPTTLLVSDKREAYRHYRSLTSGIQKVAHLVDNANLMGQGAGAVVGAYELGEQIRAQYLVFLRDFAEQKQTAAKTQKIDNPTLAQKTLIEALERLEDDETLARLEESLLSVARLEPVLIGDDKKHLEQTTRGVREELADVELRLGRYNSAQQKVLEARNQETKPRSKFDLLVAAQEIYPDYPGLKEQLEEARDGIAALEANDLEKQMTEARRLMGRDDYPQALQMLHTARAKAATAIPDPKPNSPLRRALDHMARLEDTILKGEADHMQMLALLKSVDALMNEYEKTNAPAALREARELMNSLSSGQTDRTETRLRRARLSGLQTVDENWDQGRAAYERGQWPAAIDPLQRVAKTNAPQSEEANHLIGRAQAVLHVALAEGHETDSRFDEARVAYDNAVALFAAHNTDRFTTDSQRKAAAGVERMAQKAKNNAAVEAQLNSAKRLLLSATQRAAGRQLLDDKVTTIEEFPQVVSLLDGALAMDSTHKVALEGQRSIARQEWRRVYVDGMKAALASKELNVLNRARALGANLDENGLLSEAEDRQTYRELEAKWLEADYTRLKRVKPIDWEAVEVNLRRQLDIVHEASPELERQYHETIEKRVLEQLESEQHGKRRKGTTAALSYLRNELNTNPDLWGRTAVVEEFMWLLWESREWEEAKRRAKGLATRDLPDARQLSALWLGLTEGARFLEGRNDVGFEGEMERVLLPLEEDNVNPMLRALYDRQRSRLVEKLVNQLVNEASRMTASGTPDDLTGAASRYALANRLDSTDGRITTNLNAIQYQLSGILESAIEEAEDLTLTVPLEPFLRGAKKLHATLVDLGQVGEALKMSQQTLNSLRTTADDLNRRLSEWSTLKAQLDQFENKRMQACATPTPFQGPNGGWDLGPAKTQLDSVQRFIQDKLPASPQLQSLLQSKKAEFAALTTTAANLNRLAREVLQAADGEEFDKMGPTAQALQQEWAAAQYQNFAGLENVLLREDSFKGTPIATLNDHILHSQRQAANYDLWRKWADRIVAAYGAVDKGAKFLKEDLDSARQSRTLEEIKNECHELLNKCEDYTDEAFSQPSGEPISNKAVAEKARFSETWNTRVEDRNDGLRRKAQERLDQVNADEDKLKNEMHRLDNIMSNLKTAAKPKNTIIGPKPADPGPVWQWIKKAEEQLAECQRLDPQNLDLGETRRDIDAFKKQFSAR